MAQMQTIAEMVMVMKAVYPHYLKDADAKATATSWAVLFNDTPDEDFTEAFKRCLKKCTFPPTPADIENQLKAKAMTKINPSTEWVELMDACDKIIELQNMFYFSAMCDCGKTQGKMAREEAERVFLELSPPLREYIGSYSAMLQFAREIDGQSETGVSICRRDYEKWRSQRIDSMTNRELMDDFTAIDTARRKLLTGVLS